MKQPPKRTQRKQHRPVAFDAVRSIARELAGSEEGTSYGTPAFRVKGKLFARQHQDGRSLVVRIDDHQRDLRMAADPHTFFITDHYHNTPWMLVDLATVAADDLRALLHDAWQLSLRGRQA